MITISLNTDSKEPIYEQIYKYIRDEIVVGNMECGMKLPSTRGLATHLAVSRNTVDMAYGQLVSEGYVEAVPQKGYFVCDLENLYLEGDLQRTVLQSPKIDKFYQKDDAQKEHVQVDFSPSGVDMRYFPYSKWRRLMKDCLIDDNKELFLSGNHQGDEPLRKAILRYLHQSRGIQCDVSQIIVGAGSDYMLLLLSKILGESKTVVMENPAYKQAYTIFQSVGYQVKPVEVDEHGICVKSFREEAADLVYVTPSHQFPLGTVLTAGRRQQLLTWAMNAENRYIIEDDYDSEFRYFGKPIPALQSQDPFEKVIYIGTLSKAIAPGIRISYMVLPPALLRRYYDMAHFYFSTVSRIDQKVIGEFFVQGHFERHLNRMRKIYKIKHDLLLRLIKESEFPMQVSGDSAGLHLLLHFGEVVENAAELEMELTNRAYQEGVKVYPLMDYYITECKRRPTILIGYAKLSEQEIREGIERLQRAWMCGLL